MPRVKRGTKRRQRRKKILERASGYFLTKSKLHRAAKEAVERSEREYGRPTTEPVYVDFDYKGKGLQVRFTVHDEGTFTTPWSSAVTYRRSGSEWGEIACAENTSAYYPGATTTVPHADKPDF